MKIDLFDEERKCEFAFLDNQIDDNTLIKDLSELNRMPLSDVMDELEKKYSEKYHETYPNYEYLFNCIDSEEFADYLMERLQEYKYIQFPEVTVRYLQIMDHKENYE